MPKRIAIVSSSCWPVSAGGVSSAQYNLYCALRRKGYEARIFTFGDYNVPSDEQDIIRAGVPPWVEKLVATLTGLYFRLVDPGKVAYHVSEVVSVAWPCLRLRRMVHNFRPDVLILSDHGCPGLVIGKPKNCRTILVSHHNPARFLNNPLWRLHSELDSRVTIRCENRVLRNVDVVVCPSQYMLEMFTRTYDYSGPVTVIPNLVDVELIAATPARDLRSALGLPDDSVLVYIPSAGNTYKGSRFVFEIIRRLSSHTSKDVGFYLSGSLNAELSYELGFAPSNAKIYAPGHVSYADNVAIVKACSFGISPTLVENFSMALLEANVCGLPIVSFDVGGNAEVIRNGTSGVLVPYLDLEALVGAALRFMEGRYRSDMRRETLRYALNRFGGEGSVSKIMKVMDEPLS